MTDTADWVDERVEFEPGTWQDKAAADILALAEAEGSTRRGFFNGVDMIANPGETVTDILKRYSADRVAVQAPARRERLVMERAAARPAAHVDVAALRAALAKASRGPWEGDARFQAIRDGAGDWAADIAWEGDLELIVLLRNNIEALLDEVERSRAATLLARELPIEETA